MNDEEKAELESFLSGEWREVLPNELARYYANPNDLASLPAPKVARTVIARSGRVVIEDSERKFLRPIQREIDALDKQIYELGNGSILARKKQMRRLVVQGGGTAQDKLIFGPGVDAFLAAKKMRRPLRERREALRQRAKETLLAIARRVEVSAREVLPQLEAEDRQHAESFGGTWTPSPLILDVARLCWCPTSWVAHHSGVYGPRDVLRRLGIKL